MQYSNSISALTAQQVYELLQNKLVHPNCEITSEDKYVIIDVRDSEEYKNGHILHSLHIPHEIFMENEEKTLRELISRFGGKNYSLIFHCHYSSQRGPSSALAFSTYLEEQQENLFKHLFVLKGGWHQFSFLYKDDPSVVKL